MKRGRRIYIAGLICAAPLTASAASLPIDGTYGNEAGCKLALTGNYGEDDSAQIVTPDSLQTMVTACTFTKTSPAPGNRHQVVMTCASEGEGPESNIEDKAEISGDSVSGYTVRFEDGNSWGPLKKCS